MKGAREALYCVMRFEVLGIDRIVRLDNFPEVLSTSLAYSYTLIMRDEYDSRSIIKLNAEIEYERASGCVIKHNAYSTAVICCELLDNATRYCMVEGGSMHEQPVHPEH